MCKKARNTDPRAKYCCDKHKWRAWWQRAAAASAQTQALPLVTLPAEAEQLLLPLGPTERLLIAIQLALVGLAPAGARGYRVGTQHGQSPILRWFPAAKLRDVPMFSLDPFEPPAVPARGTYAVVYMTRRCEPIGGPRFSIQIDQENVRIHHSDGDRTYKPRLRGDPQ